MRAKRRIFPVILLALLAAMPADAGITFSSVTSGTCSGGGVTLSSIAITPLTPTPTIGQTVQFTATGTYSNASTLNITSAAAWNSSTPSVATISSGSAGGIASVLTSGTTTISATLGAITSNSVSVTIAGTLFRSGSPVPPGIETLTAFPVVYKKSFYIPSDVTQVTLHMSNRAYTGGVGDALTGVNIALYKSDGSGSPTGNPLGKWLSQNIPNDDTDWVAPAATPITRGTDGKISLVHSAPANQHVAYVLGMGHGTYANSTSVVDPIPADSGAANDILWPRFDYVTAKRRIIVIGDSISDACYAAGGMEISAWYQLGPLKDYAVFIVGLPGGLLSQFAAPNTYPDLWSDGKFAGADVWIEAGTNDLPQGATAMNASFTTIVNRLRSLGVNKIYTNTIAPQGSYAGTEAARTTHNAFRVANSLGLDGIADFAAPRASGGLASDTDSTKLSGVSDGVTPSFSVDTTHWTDAGHNQAYAKVVAVTQYLIPNPMLLVALARLLRRRRAANDNRQERARRAA